MTSREKRALRAQGLDPAAIQRAAIAAQEAALDELEVVVDFSGRWDGQRLDLDGLDPSEAMACHVVAAMHEALGLPIPSGEAVVPKRDFDRCLQAVVEYGVEDLRKPELQIRIKLTK